MTQLLNIATGKPEDIDPVDIPQRLAEATHMGLGGDRPLVTPGGELHIVPFDQVHKALNMGYKVPNQEQLDHFAGEAKYGGGANAAKAAGLGALRGASFGASDLVGGAVNTDYPEYAEAMKTYHPAATVGGEIAGAIGSALLAPEASPAGLASKLGTGAAEHLAPEGASALRQIAAHAVGMGAEGAAYGAGQTVSALGLHEDSLGKPDQLAEHLIANVGLGAALGGSLGGLFKAGQIAIPKSIGAAQDAAGGIYKALTGRAIDAAKEAGEAAPGTVTEMTGLGAPTIEPSPLSKLAAKVSGKTEEEALADMKKGYESTPMTDLERKQHAGKTAKAFQEYIDATGQVERDTMGAARMEETANLINQADQAPMEPEYIRLMVKADEAAAAMRAEPELYPNGAAREMELVRDRLMKAGPDTEGSTLFENLNNAKRELYATRDAYIGKGSRPTPSERRAGDFFNEVYQDTKGSLENPDVWGAAGARQAKMNEAYSQFRSDRDVFLKRFGESNGKGGKVVSGTKFNTHFNAINDPVRAPLRQEALENLMSSGKSFLDQAEETHKATSFEHVDLTPLKEKMASARAMAEKGQTITKAAPGGLGYFTDLFNPVGTLMKAAKGLSNPEAIGAVLANIERTNQKVGTKISSGIKAVFKPVATTAKKGFGVISEVLTSAEKAEKIKAKIDEVQDHVQSPERLVDVLHNATKDGADAAPKTMAAVQAATLKGLQFLQSKIPPTPQATPFEKPRDIPSDQLATFARYYTAVHNPMSVLQDLKRGVVHPEAIGALQAVYPNLYSKMQQEAIEQVGTVKDKGTIPFQTRLTLSKFMGQPLDSLLTPQAIQSAQVAFTMPDQGKPAMKPSAKGMQKLNIAGRMETDFQHTSTKERQA